MEDRPTARIALHADEVDAVIECLADPITAVRELLAVATTPDVRAPLEARLALLLRVQAVMVAARADLPHGLPADPAG